MRYVSLFLGSLLACGLMLGQNLQAGADCPAEAEKLVGTYHGVIRYADDESRRDPVSSQLVLTADCRLKGVYSFEENNKIVPGTFFPIKIVSPTIVKLYWHDPYGEGILEATFDTAARVFTGTWGSDYNSTNGGWWNGEKQPDKTKWSGCPKEKPCPKMNREETEDTCPKSQPCPKEQRDCPKDSGKKPCKH
jgi:hypothetical protein